MVWSQHTDFPLLIHLPLCSAPKLGNALQQDRNPPLSFAAPQPCSITETLRLSPPLLGSEARKKDTHPQHSSPQTELALGQKIHIHPKHLHRKAILRHLEERVGLGTNHSPHLLSIPLAELENSSACFSLLRLLSI